jgi:hypothetical protein
VILTHARSQTIVVDPITKTITVIEEDGTQNTNTAEPNNETNDDIQNEAPSTEETNNESVSENETPTDTDETPSTEETTNTSETTDNTLPISSPVDEFDQALAWMYTYGMTSFDTRETYRPFDFVTREQFAKMVDQFATAIDYDDSTRNTDCAFTDIDGADPTLIPHIRETCRLGIFRGYGDGTFRPFQQVTRAETLTVLLRLYNDRSLDETPNPRYLNYYNQAVELGITDETIITNMDLSTNRYLVAIYLWRLANIR